MGLLIATIRLQYLNQVRNDLEYKIQLITQSKMALTQSASDLLQVGNDYDAESPVTKMLAQRQQKLKLLEQKLDQQMLQYQTRLKMIETEYQSCQQMLQQGIQRSCRYEL